MGRNVPDDGHPGFPDCNTAMMSDPQGKLFLFWPVILANSLGVLSDPCKSQR